MMLSNHEMGQAESLWEGLELLHRLREQALDDGVTWVMPHDVLPTMYSFHGTPVIHADVPQPYLAHPVRHRRSRLQIERALELSANLESESGPVTEAELEELRKVWPPS